MFTVWPQSLLSCVRSSHEQAVVWGSTWVLSLPPPSLFSIPPTCSHLTPLPVLQPPNVFSYHECSPRRPSHRSSHRWSSARSVGVGRAKGKECSEWVSKVIHRTHFRGEAKQISSPESPAVQDKNSSKAHHFSLECWLEASLKSREEAGLCQGGGPLKSPWPLLMGPELSFQ